MCRYYGAKAGGEAGVVDGRNYARNTILALSRLDKPFIICGKFYAHFSREYVTYTEIRPYVPKGASTNLICDHLNVMEKDVEKYICIDPRYNYRSDILVCRAMMYTGSDGNVRGGIFLTDELGIPPVMLEKYARSRGIVESVDPSRYVDFFSFAEGRYAYYGKNIWASGHKAKPRLTWAEKQMLEAQRKQEKRKKKPPRKEVSLEEFMQMYKERNPLWIPPAGNLNNNTAWMKKAVPQKDLRAILERQPSLRKKVYQEFLKRC